MQTAQHEGSRSSIAVARPSLAQGLAAAVVVGFGVGALTAIATAAVVFAFGRLA